MTHLERYTTDHKALLAAAARATGLTDLVAIQLDDYRYPLIKQSVRGPVLPLNGVLIRDWDRDFRHFWPGIDHGVRAYRTKGLTFVHVVAQPHNDVPSSGYDFFAVPRADYVRLYRHARWCKSQSNPPGPPPILRAETLASLLRNTVDYLDSENLKEIQSYGGRPKRGLLLTGPPGNGKTSACRWVWQQCQAKGLEYRIVSPDDFRAARQSSCPSTAVKQLFTVGTAGVIFFDDLDLALRNRSHVENPEDQAVFLSALDGIEANRGVVYVFTTNLPPDRIDPAFLRPGRIDAILHFPRPSADLRRALIGTWAEAIRAAVDPDRAVRETDGMSFAEVEEIKNLIVLRFTEMRAWDWAWAIDQFHANRREIETLVRDRVVGFTKSTSDREAAFDATVAGAAGGG